MIKLSVIVPAFNVEKWLARCLDSCISQDQFFDSCEIIVVNDGSTDNTESIALKYCELYSNIKLISKANGGLSSARNAGLDVALGKYVFFLDSDDWISESSFSKILHLTRYNPDVISIGYNLVYKDRVETFLPNGNSGKELLSSLNYQMGAPFWILNKNFVQEYGLAFKEGIFHEDNEFTPRVLYLASIIKTLDYPIYNYFIQDCGTITSTPNIKRSYDLLEIVDSYKKFVDEYVDKTDEYLFREHAMLAFNSCCANARLCTNEEKKKIYEYISSNNVLHKYLFLYNNYKHIKYFCESIVGRFFRKIFLLFMIRPNR